MYNLNRTTKVPTVVDQSDRATTEWDKPRTEAATPTVDPNTMFNKPPKVVAPKVVAPVEEVVVDDTVVDVKLFGATSGAYLLCDESADKLCLSQINMYILNYFLCVIVELPF